MWCFYNYNYLFLYINVSTDAVSIQADEKYAKMLQLQQDEELAKNLHAMEGDFCMSHDIYNSSAKILYY